MQNDELKNGQDPLLDEDEVLDFLLYEQMNQEDKAQRRTGCLGAAIFFVMTPAVWLACRWL